MATRAASSRSTTAYILFGGSGVTALMVWACFEMPVVFVGVIALAISVWLATQIKLFAAVTLLASVFIPTLQNVAGAGGLEYVDEIMIAALLVLSLVHVGTERRRVAALPGGWAFTAFLLFAAVGAVATGASPLLVGLDAFLIMKGILFAFAVAQIRWVDSDLKMMAKVGGWIVALVILGAAVNVAVPGIWLPIFASTENLNERGGVVNVISLFGHPGAFGQMMALSAIALLCYRHIVRKTPITAALMWGSFLGAILSTRRKAIIGLAAVVGWFAFSRKPAATALVIIALTPPLLLLSGSQIQSAFGEVYDEYFVNPDGAARTVLYRSAVDLANTHFPLGVGLSHYGGFVARENYSPFYVQQGFAGVWGLQQGGRFLTDTFWPMILGEGGWFGLTAFALGLILLARTALRVARLEESSALARWAGTVGMVWSIEFAFESIAAPAYTSPPANLLLFGILGVTSSLWANRKSAGAATATNYFPLTSEIAFGSRSSI
ncbi:hypothetical protein [Microbacterium sp. cx-59]|uniref:hypothetical protein n=1 Tax=Microbacterium sp. cx-59 TaxID=2891207 RepID=UPI001E6335B8|nr:hypothetical protein [Microbacterium sp. cx-59]MCC4908100.1 hypothetical protein [Microbacterium sp. cx-59]